MKKLLLLFGVLVTNAMFAGISIQQMENSEYEKTQTRRVEISADNLDLSSEGLYAFFNGPFRRFGFTSGFVHLQIFLKQSDHSLNTHLFITVLTPTFTILKCQYAF